MILRLSSGVRCRIAGPVGRSWLSTSAPESFTKTKVILEVPLESEVPRRKPGRIENFYEKYARRPLYGYAPKGDNTYWEMRKLAVWAAIYSGIIYAFSTVYIYINIHYFLTDDEKLELDYVNRRKSFSNIFDEETAKFRKGLQGLEFYSDLGRFKAKLAFDLERIVPARERDPSGLPDDDRFRLARDVWDRKRSEREKKFVQQLNKSLKDFDEELRK